MPSQNLIKSNLALAYKILAKLNYDDHTYTHLSARDPDNSNYFYIYPFGLRFEEVDADNLLTVSLEGEIIKGAEYQYNKTGYIIHGNIYAARPDINAIFHLHTPESIAVSVQQEGLLPISQWALHFYNKLSYHDYDSLALENSQGEKLIHDLKNNYNILLRHHGFITSGKTIEEAMFYTHHLQKACETQCKILAMHRDYIIPPHDICQKAVEDLLSFEQNLGERDWQAWKRWIHLK